jgi:pectinesterase
LKKVKNLLFLSLCAFFVFSCAVEQSYGDSQDPLKVITSPENATAPSGAVIVASDGTGNYKDVQSAVNSLSGTARATIWVKNGTYSGHVKIARANVTLLGQSTSAILTTAIKQSSGGWYDAIASVSVTGSGFIAQDITFQNTAGQSGNQALAFAVLADKAKFTGCNFLGYQDTLFIADSSGNGNARSYFYKCYIAGNIDFIYGPATAVFDSCTLYVRAYNSSTNGYCTAANTSTSNTYKYGFVFLNCTISGNAASGSQYLGRPWGANAYVIYKNCSMGALIKAAGWTDMSGNKASSARLYEYKSTGAGAAVNSTRRQLTDSQASAITVSSVLGGWVP